MNFTQQILFFFSFLGGFNGLITTCYLFFKKDRKSSDLFLGILLLMLSVRVIKSVFLYFDPLLPKIYLQIGLSACFLIGPSLYLYTRSVLGNPFIRWKFFYMVNVLAIVIIGLLFPYEIKPEYWAKYIVKLIYLQWAVFIILSGFSGSDILKRKLKKESLSREENIWFWVYVAVFVIFLSYLVVMLVSVRKYYISGALSFSLVFYITSLQFFGKKEKSVDITKNDKYQNKKIENTIAEPLLEQIDTIIKQQELFRNPNLKLQDVCSKVNMTTHQLSQLLNDNLGKNFSTYINEFRINEACDLILKNDKMKIEEIGYEVGFNSKSTFFTTFKKVKNTTPLLFKENYS